MANKKILKTEELMKNQYRACAAAEARGETYCGHKSLESLHIAFNNSEVGVKLYPGRLKPAVKRAVYNVADSSISAEDQHYGVGPS